MGRMGEGGEDGEDGGGWGGWGRVGRVGEKEKNLNPKYHADFSCAMALVHRTANISDNNSSS